MPYKAIEQRREAVRKSRQRTGEIPEIPEIPVVSVSHETPAETPAREIPNETPNETPHYPSILYALSDPIQRQKMQAIVDSLAKGGYLKDVYRGAGKYSLRMDTVAEMLKAVSVPSSGESLQLISGNPVK